LRDGIQYLHSIGTGRRTALVLGVEHETDVIHHVAADIQPDAVEIEILSLPAGRWLGVLKVGAHTGADRNGR
jgi:hypothetical protein